MVVLELPDIAPTWGMEIRYELRGAEGEPASGNEPVVQRRQLDPAGGLHRSVGVVALVHHPERLDRARAPVLRSGLMGMEAGRMHARDVGAGIAVDDPMGDRPPDARPAGSAGRDRDPDPLHYRA